MENNLIKKYVNIITFWERYNQQMSKKVPTETKSQLSVFSSSVPKVASSVPTSSEDKIEKDTILTICNLNRSKRARLNLGAITYHRFITKDTHQGSLGTLPERPCVVSVCTCNRSKRAVVVLNSCKIETFLKRAEPILGIRVHEVVLEENGVIVNDNNFKFLHKEPLMLLQSGEKWYNCDTSQTLDYIKNLDNNKLIAICNQSREKKTILSVPNDLDFASFLLMASKYLNVNGKLVACEDTGMIVNDFEILNEKERVLMILEQNHDWHPR